MARAKRTERAEARRRYREATSAVEDGDEGLDAPVVPEAALPRSSRERQAPTTTVAASPPGIRQGFAGTLRAAAGPVDIRGDIAALPSLLVSKAALIPGAVILGTAIALFIPAVASNQLVALAGNIILQPPPMIIAFLAGMLAPRGAWLMGGLASVLAGLAYALVVTATTDVLVTPLAFTYTVSPDQKLGYVQSVLLSAPVFGIAVGAFAGFYRRFLNLSSPQRQGGRRR